VRAGGANHCLFFSSQFFLSTSHGQHRDDQREECEAFDELGGQNDRGRASFGRPFPAGDPLTRPGRRASLPMPGSRADTRKFPNNARPKVPNPWSISLFARSMQRHIFLSPSWRNASHIKDPQRPCCSPRPAFVSPSSYKGGEFRRNAPAEKPRSRFKSSKFKFIILTFDFEP